MKRIIVFLCIIACFLLGFSLVAYAHSGGTDSAGGHYNHSTGEYHYHHGHPAHQHPDGVCPYGDYGKENTNYLKQNETSKNDNVDDYSVVIFVVISILGSILFFTTARKSDLVEKIVLYAIPFIAVISIIALPFCFIDSSLHDYIWRWMIVLSGSIISFVWWIKGVNKEKANKDDYGMKNAAIWFAIMVIAFFFAATHPVHALLENNGSDHSFTQRNPEPNEDKDYIFTW